MEDAYDMVKYFITGMVCQMLAFFSPIQNDLIVMITLLSFNFIFGYLDSILVKGERFDIRKFFRAILEGVAFGALFLLVFFIGRMKDCEDIAMQCVSFITYSACYFYGVNILRNWRALMPGNTLVAFLYDVLSMEGAKRLPFVSAYMEKHKKTDKTQEK